MRDMVHERKTITSETIYEVISGVVSKIMTGVVFRVRGPQLL
jgi:hypothetical protein